MKIRLLTICIILGINIIYAQNDKFGFFLKKALEFNQSSEKTWIVWIYFTDKGIDAQSKMSNPLNLVSEKSLQRRMKVNPYKPVDITDVPVNQVYVEALKPYLQSIRHYSKWFNAISAEVKSGNLNDLAAFDFVKKVELIERYKIDKKRKNEIENSVTEFPLAPNASITALNYGSSYTQNNQINVPSVHNTGNYGQGITICVMDAGFNLLTHNAFEQMNIIATYDFVNHRPYVGDGQGGQGSGSHGTQTLSTIGGYISGSLIGPAFGASYILAKTENTDSETPIEMDNWAAALEWADSIGVDVTSTSLGYLDFDPPYPSLTYLDMNGHTALITNASDMAAGKGIVVVNSAGNEGYNATRNTLGAPADGDSVLSIGAVTSSGTRSSFSSVGNTVDGRIKPDLMAMGSGVVVANPYNVSTTTTASGTSFSCPLAAGAAALILSENPNLTPMKVREALRKTASRSSNPDREYGWGIINTLAAVNYFNISMKTYTFYDSNNVNGPYKFAVKLTSRLTIDQNKVFLIWGRNQITDTLPMTKITSDSFSVQIFGNGSPAVYKYYFYAATTTDSIYKTYPKYAPRDLLSFKVGGSAVSVTFPIKSDWNLISVPLSVADYSKSILFPNATSNAFLFNDGYQITYTLENGRGYWLKFPENYNHTMVGQIISSFNIPLSQGWNLIGSLKDSINVSGIQTSPPNLIASNFFEYDNGYKITNLIRCGRGYWIKSSGSGSIILTLNSSLQPKITETFNSKNAIKFRTGDKSTSLYFNFNGNNEYLPPLPPSGIFDVRFSDDRMTTNRLEDFIIINSDNDAVLISTEKSFPFTCELSEINGTVIGILEPGKELLLNNQGVSSKLFKIKFINEKPGNFRLYGNYPNPFNPSTKISFEIPEKNLVQLTIFDILGNQLVRCLDEVKDKGYYEYEFNTSNFNIPTGIYFYELKSGNFRAVGKMSLVK